MNIAEKVNELIKELDNNKFYLIQFNQRVDGECQHFYLCDDMAGARLDRDHRKATLFNPVKDDISLFINLGYCLVTTRTHQSLIKSANMDHPAWVGDWDVELAPCMVEYDNSLRLGFTVSKEGDVQAGYVFPPVHVTEEKPIIVHDKESMDSIVEEQLNARVTPDFFDGFDILSVQDILTLLRTFKWQNADKVKCAGQHAVRQKKDMLIYEFGINGVIHIDILNELYSVLKEQGWTGASTAVSGMASGSWTRLMLHRKVAV
ncbi:hypothetical protein RVBP21_1090 [Pseudomonas phage BRkr]|nr:hypothetical protein RVBP21_1090 [Pseudomonas phage BRkr]